MRYFKKKGLALINLLYWFLLVYIVAALVYWFILLETQNRQMFVYRVQQLKKDDPAYFSAVSKIMDDTRRKTSQYIGEGSTFLVLILIGAVFVYRAIRRQLRLSQQQQNFMMAVTHELKTPIAITSLNLETLQKRKLEETQQQKLIANTLQEVARLNTLCNNILISSQLEAGAYLLNKQAMDFSSLVAGSVKDFQTRYPQRLIQSAVAPGIYVEGEQLLLQMMVNNLVENALKYSPKDKTIQVALRSEHRHVYLSVKDEGEGIPDEEKKRIFDKFYRIGNENTRKAKGTGLGLYLCRKIAADHKGSIQVTNNEPNGSNFTVTLQSTTV